jgi:hypothetical protein
MGRRCIFCRSPCAERRPSVKLYRAAEELANSLLACCSHAAVCSLYEVSKPASFSLFHNIEARTKDELRLSWIILRTKLRFMWVAKDVLIERHPDEDHVHFSVGYGFNHIGGKDPIRQSYSCNICCRG